MYAPDVLGLTLLYTAVYIANLKHLPFFSPGDVLVVKPGGYLMDPAQGKKRHHYDFPNFFILF